MSFNLSNIFFDKPIIYTPDPLNEIIISKNGKVLWSKKGLSINERILGPINWPIDPLKPNEEYMLSLRPKGIPSGEFGNILISASPELIRFDDLVDSLGENKNKWIKTINKMFKEDKNLAFALLLSNKLITLFCSSINLSEALFSIALTGITGNLLSSLTDI